jgi:asparagine synthase (glutamine-hydrolysing)
MCGIAGFVAPGLPADECGERLERMLGSIVHRGPDGAGRHVAEGLALGMRRLSIIDLAGGTQPIWNEDHTIAVAFNGEIYNYVELTRELIAAGHHFTTQTDTEVLVHLYEDADLAMFSRLRGMFGFALLDLRKPRLVLARDHFGQKPLYYSTAAGRFAFASEMKALLTLPWIPRDAEPGAFLDFTAWLSLPAPRTHLRAISKLQPGAHLVVPLDAPATAQPRKYWSYTLDAPPDLTEQEPAADALDAALRESVQLHLRADVPIGVLLSSGLDSRLVVSYAQEFQGGKVQTFTVGFGTGDSEVEGAEITAREIGSQHHTLHIGAEEFASGLAQVAWHLDEPIGDIASFAVWKVCELARHHVKVLLSGEGADELFAGYEDRYQGALATMQRTDRLRPFRAVLPSGDPAAVSGWQRFATRVNRTPASEIAALRREGLPGNVLEPLGLTPAQLRRIHERAEDLGGAVFRPQRDLLSALLCFDIDWQLPESLLQKADKMSMAASIELRTPILDREVAAVAARIPSALKLPPSGPGKSILRHTLARRLNEPFRRPKKGFPVPLAEWFSGPLRAQATEEIFAAQAAWRTELDERLIRIAWEDQLAGRWDGGRFFFALWMHTLWQRTLAS